MKKIIALTFAAFTLTGCSHKFGPNAIRKTHAGYNDSMVSMVNEQLLLNMVRMRYRDNPYFLEIERVTSEHQLYGSIGFSTDIYDYNGNTYKPSLGATTHVKPNIFYTPLSGSNFIKKMLTQIDLSIIMTMIQSGWNVDRVFALAVERMNGIYNAPEASGPTPIYAPEQTHFQRVLEIFRNLQKEHLIVMDMQPNHNFPQPMLGFKESKDHQKEIYELKEILNIAQDLEMFKMKKNFLDLKKSSIVFRFRSLLGILFYLSQAIEVPASHVENGLVNITRNKDGSLFNWNSSIGAYFNVHVANSKPDNAFLAVPYRNHWFYIEDNDLQSKTTFMLMTQLFNLQAGFLKSNSPILTLSAK